MSFFVNQSILKISLDTNQETLLNTATVKRIYYKKPGGSSGYWTATQNTSKLEYQTENGDIDEAGLWQFQSYIEVSGSKAWGEIQTINFINPLQ